MMNHAVTLNPGLFKDASGLFSRAAGERHVEPSSLRYHQ